MIVNNWKGAGEYKQPAWGQRCRPCGKTWQRNTPEIHYENCPLKGKSAVKNIDRLPGAPFVLLDTDASFLEQLPDRFVMPLKLVHQGTSYANVALALDLPSGTIKSRIHRARGAIERMRRGEKPLIASGRE